MANRELLINVGIGETRIAIVEDGRLAELIFDRAVERGEGRSGHSIVGNVYVGRAQRVVDGMQAAFLDVGLDKAGFLAAKDARCLTGQPDFDLASPPPISGLVREGDAILVQAIKDPIVDKGVRLSANVTLPGRLLVLLPLQAGIALSRKIEDETERARLTEATETALQGAGLTGGGVIVRTVAAGASAAELEEDIRDLVKVWTGIQAARADAKVPSCLYQDLGPVSRSLRDHVNAETSRILIDDADAVAEARAYMAAHMPAWSDRLSYHAGPGALFDGQGLEAQIEAALEPRVSLPSGGWITMETTEALTAIDVNSGSYTEGRGLEETSLRTNLEAAKEITHQLRLRGLGGIVVVDFIHMERPDSILKVLMALEEGVARDRAPVRISAMSAFGLVEMTRKRVREPLDRLLTEACKPCHQTGRLRTPATVANELLRRLEREARNFPGRPLIGRAHPDVLGWLEARRTTLLSVLEQRLGVPVKFECQASFPRGRIDIGIG